jgi:hypothetical protein
MTKKTVGIYTRGAVQTPGLKFVRLVDDGTRCQKETENVFEANFSVRRSIQNDPLEGK